MKENTHTQILTDFNDITGWLKTGLEWVFLA